MSVARLLIGTAACLLGSCAGIVPLQLNSAPLATTVRTVARFDHGRLDGLLRRHVDGEGYVDYPGLQQEQRELDAYLDSLAGVDPDGFADGAERKAYWINAYNAITLAGMARHYATRSIRDLPGFWQRITTNCGGRLVSLDDIEHVILRPLGDPRIHMAINCASLSCPRLWNRAYTGAGLEDQLDAAARAFLADSQRNRFDADRRRAELSMIFSWFASDFEVAPYHGIRGFVRRFAPDVPWLADDYAISYLPYDWSLNERRRRG